MTQRTEFTDFECWSGADIIRHPDGSLTIETQAEYGDTEMGWGSASATIKMDADQVRAFRAFLNGEAGMQGRKE